MGWTEGQIGPIQKTIFLVQRKPKIQLKVQTEQEHQGMFDSITGRCLQQRKANYLLQPTIFQFYSLTTDVG